MVWGCESKLTDSGDDDDGVEQRAGEGPLDVVDALIAVPAAHLHLQQYRALEVLNKSQLLRLRDTQMPTT